MAFVKAGFSGRTCALAWIIKYVHYQLVQVAMQYGAELNPVL